MAIIEVRNVSKIYNTTTVPVQALKHNTFHVEDK